MVSYKETIVIRRPLEEVFAYMQDIDKEREWQPNLREAEQEPAGPPGPGTVRRYVSEFMGRSIKNSYVYTVFERNRRVVYESTPESAMQAEGTMTWEALDEGTRVTIQVEAELPGLLKLAPAAIVTSISKRELADALVRLRAQLEDRD